MKLNIKSEIIQSSFILLIFMNLFNVAGYIFQSISARMLGPSDYGILAVLMSIIYIFGVPSEAIQTIISKYATKFSINNEDYRIKNLMNRGLKKFLFLGIFCFFIFSSFSPLIGKILDINTRLILLTGATIIIVFTLPVLRGVLQGMKKFTILGTTFLFEGLAKIFFGFTLIFVGLKVYGAIGAIVISFIISFIYSFFVLKKYLKQEGPEEKIEGIYSYSIPVLITLLCITLLYSSDVIIAKIFFPLEIVGQYAVISLLGKIIFFVTSPLTKSMFTLVSERHQKKTGSMDLLRKVILLVFGMGLIALIFYYFIPEFIISIVFGTNYLTYSGLLYYSGLSIFFLSLTNIITTYLLSTGNEKKNYFMIPFVILQISLLYFFHDTLYQFISMLILSNVFLFLTMLFILLISIRRNK
jgi:O-antigen/teichoic acid export membrane protein